MTQTKKKRSPFVMPEGYVEDFTLRMMQRIDAEAPVTQPARTVKPRGKVMRLYMRYAAGVAAALALFMVCTRTAPEQMQEGNSNMARTTVTNDSKAMAATQRDALYDYFMFNGQTIYNYEAYGE